MIEGLDQLVQAASADGPGRIRAAAKLMTRIEDQPEILPRLFRGMAKWPEPRLILGVTGAPGSGKSTLTDQLVAEYRHRTPDKRVGVVAVDPSSPFTGGAVLGDRVRMMRHATDPMVFVRSLATRGHLGGLTLGIKGVLRVMGLLGCDTVLVETVGVGQSEIEVVAVADLVMIVMAPGQGDSIQLLKAGLMEAGDVFVVNKADRQGAAQLHAELTSALRLGQAMHRGEHQGHDDQCPHHLGSHDVQDLAIELGAGRREQPRIFLASATEGTGLSELVEGLEELIAHGGPRRADRRRLSLEQDVRQSLFEAARRRVAQVMGNNGAFSHQLDRVLSGDLSIEQLAQELLARAASRGTAEGSTPGASGKEATR